VYEDLTPRNTTGDLYTTQTESLDDNIKIEDDPPQRITDEMVLSEILSTRQKSVLIRPFLSVSKGGIRSSIFTLFSGTVGAGILSLPNVRSKD